EKGADQISNNLSVRQAAFTQEIQHQGNNSDVIELTPGKVVVMRFNQRLPQIIQPLTAVKSKIIERLLAKNKQDKTQKLAEEIKQALNKGTLPAVIEKENHENHLVWQTVEKTPRHNSKIAQAI